MEKKKKLTFDSEILRQKAEALLNKKSLKTGSKLSRAEILKLIHELEVHHIELGMQYDEMMLAKEQAESATKKFTELYDFAPTGYFVLSSDGKIIELNLNGANMLGKERSLLKNSQLGFFISNDTKTIFNLFLGKIFTCKSLETCEVVLSTNSNQPIIVQMTGIVSEHREQCNVTVVDITERKQLENTQNFLLKCGYPGSDENFFDSLARYLAQILNMDYVCIDRLEEDGLTAQTVAVFNDGKFETNVVYALKETPCGDVVGKTICCFPENVCRLFPNDSALQDLRAESYVGTTLWSFDGKPIGLIAVIGRKILRNPKQAEAVLKLVAIRAAGEMERTNYEDELKLSKQRLEMAQRSSGAGIWDWDMQTQHLVWSPELYHIFGMDPSTDKASFDSWSNMIHPEDKDIARFRIEQAIEKKTALNSEYRVVYNSQVHWIAALGNTIYDESDHPTRMSGICIDITKRKQAEEALRVSEERLRTITDNAPDIILEMDRQGRIVYMNRVLHGIQMEDVIGGKFMDWAPVQYHELIKRALDKVFTTGVPQSFQTQGYGVNGELRWFQANLSPVKGREKVESVIGIASDITEYKLAEESVRKAEAKHLAILGTAMDGFWLLDMNGIILEVNEIYCKMSGYSTDELVGMKFQDIEAIETESDSEAHIRKVLTEGEDRFESRHRHKDGSMYDVEVSVQYQAVEGGRLVTFLHDITERKLSEEKLHQSEERYKSLFQGNHSVMLLIDPATGEILDANPAASIYYGWTHSEMCCKNISEINTLSKEEVTEEMQKAKEEKRNHFFFKHRMANGDIRDVEIYSAPIKFRDSTLLYSIVHDITERKQAEEALTLNERLLRESQAVAHIGSYSADLITKTWLASPEIYEIFGIDETYPHTLEGWSRLIHPDSRDNLFEYNVQVEAEKKRFDQEYKIIRFADGKESWVHGLGEFEFDHQINPVRIIGTIQDVTKRKLAELALKQLKDELEDRVEVRTAELLISNDALQQSEVKYRTVADFTYDWEFWLDQNDTIRYCSPSCERITGYKASDFLQNPRLLLDIIHPDDLKKFQCHKQREGLVTDSNHEIQYRIVKVDGTIIWIGHVCQPIHDKSGNFIGIRGSNRDITSRKKMEHLLQTSNQQYKLVSDNITDGIFICRDGYLEYVNKAMYRIFGYHGQALKRLKLTQLVMPDYQNEVETVLLLNTKLNQIRNMEIECSRKDHSTITVEILFNYLASEKLLFGVVHDITEKKHLQKNIVKAIIQTEERERAYFSKELHDGLGPLLSLVKLYMQWTQRPKSNKSRAEIIHKAEIVIDDALATLKEISNKLSPHILTYYGLTSAIQNFVDKLGESSTIRIEFQSNAGLRLDIEIEAALYRAIIECVNNTIKYAHADNIFIMLKYSDNQFQAQYKDDGIGFDLTETLSLHKGLGLFNLQSRIQTIGGKITMFSEPGRGVDYQIVVNL